MKWRSKLSILMMVVGLSTKAHCEIVLETDDNIDAKWGLHDYAYC
jgi:hypothetical protein